MKEKWTELVYVSGPYSSDCEWDVKQNIRVAEEIGALLWSWGWVPIVPHLNTNFFGGAYGLPDKVWLKGDLAIVKVCKRMVVVPKWQNSSGTKLEITEANSNLIPVYFWENTDDYTFLKSYYQNVDNPF